MLDLIISSGAKICRGFKGQNSRCRDKPRYQKSQHYRGRNLKNSGNVAAQIMKIAVEIVKNCGFVAAKIANIGILARSKKYC